MRVRLRQQEGLKGSQRFTNGKKPPPVTKKRYNAREAVLRSGKRELYCNPDKADCLPAAYGWHRESKDCRCLLLYRGAYGSPEPEKKESAKRRSRDCRRSIRWAAARQLLRKARKRYRQNRSSREGIPGEHLPAASKLVDRIDGKS